jgi:hypothetical protein
VNVSKLKNGRGVRDGFCRIVKLKTIKRCTLIFTDVVKLAVVTMFSVFFWLCVRHEVVDTYICARALYWNQKRESQMAKGSYPARLYSL